jgi:hypothetical protein
MPGAKPLDLQKRARALPAPEIFRDHIVMHTHIEKTAGSTLTRGFIDAFGRGHVWDIRGRKREKPEFLSAADRDQIFVLAGHFLFGAHAEYFDRVPVYVACVRAPFQRFRSAYDFARTRPNHPSYPRTEGRTFPQAVEDLLKSPKSKLNIMARFLTGQVQPGLAHLLKNVEDDYLIVSPSHRVNDTLNALIPLFGGGAVDTELYRNKTPDPSSEDVGDLKELFDHANALDVQLVQFVEANYDRWLAELPARLSALGCRRPA